jgi:hypothetical protein
MRSRTMRPARSSVTSGVREHVEDLLEQPGPIGVGLGSVDQPLRQLVPGAGVDAGQGLVELVTSSSSTST